REEVVEGWEGRELLLEDIHALARDDLADLAVGIVQVAEFARAGRARLQARGHAALARAVQTERALLDHALGARPVGQVALVGVDALRRDGRLRPVEAPREVRTGHDAEAAADAPAVVDDDNPVGLLPRRADGTRPDARRVIALVALHGQVELVLDGHLLVLAVVRRRLVEVEGPRLHLEDADVPDLRIVGQVVLPRAGLDAPAASVGHGQVERGREIDAGDGRRVGDVRRDAGARERLLLDAPEDALLVGIGELLVVLPEELLGRRGAVATAARRGRGGEAGELQECPARALLLQPVLDELLDALLGGD